MDLTANEINIKKKKLDLISVVLYCYRVLCIRQATFKRGRKPVMTYDYLLLGVYQRNSPSCTVQLNCSTARGRDSSERMMEQTTAATEVEKTSAL